MMLQRTISKEVYFEGKGLHTGKLATVRLKPAPVDSGIIFCRADKGVIIKANIYSVVDTSFATTIGLNGIRIKTVEHLLAAIAGLGIDNLFIEIDGPEIPILDGSSTYLTGLILKAGITKQPKGKLFLVIKKPVVYEDRHSKIVALPYDGYSISYYIRFDHKFLRQQRLSIEINEKAFITEIAPARTFGFLKDVENLRLKGLVKGGSLENAIVIGDEGILNEEGLRFPDEFVRHKILDSIGDFLLTGYNIRGHIIFDKAGHTANINFLKKLISSEDCFTITNNTTISKTLELSLSK
ncbi:MAG: UDP-3-O-acyl-N-acetylglucosamine deacetylase [Thermodesulfovibrionales bacterium]|nr:UDP-3-O-acyl-N-acetylglucosamine deacetylase [Thermodesulfovibrionales bacterium]